MTTTIGTLYKGRNNNFDALRFLLAGLVIFSHSYPLSGASASEPIWRLTNKQIDGGKIAVDLFFVISGFLILQSWQNSKDMRAYVDKRVRRIYPGLIVALVVSAYVVGVIGADNKLAYLHQREVIAFIYRPLLFRDALSLTHCFNGNPSRGNLNASIWTIRFELFCYLGVLVLGLCKVYRRPWILALAFPVALAWYSLQKGGWSVPYFGSVGDLPRLVTYFLAGMLVYLYRDRIPHSGRLAMFCVLAAALCLHCGLIYILPICATYLTFFVVFHPGIKLQKFAAHGDFSYGMYLWGMPVQQLVVLASHSHIHPLVLGLVAFPTAVLAGALSWWYVESPFLKRRVGSREEAV